MAVECCRKAEHCAKRKTKNQKQNNVHFVLSSFTICFTADSHEQSAFLWWPGLSIVFALISHIEAVSFGARRLRGRGRRRHVSRAEEAGPPGGRRDTRRGFMTAAGGAAPTSLDPFVISVHRLRQNRLPRSAGAINFPLRRISFSRGLTQLRVNLKGGNLAGPGTWQPGFH